MSTKGIFEIRKGRYYVAMWFMDGDGVDFFGAVWRDEGDTGYHLTYRYRYHASDDPNDPNDVKNVYQWKLNAPLWHVEATMKLLLDDAKANSSDFRGRSWQRVELGTDDGDAITKILVEQPWCHLVTKGDA